MEKQNALVLGSSGFIGTRLIARLHAQSRWASITAVDIAPPRVCLPNVRYVQHDVRRPLPIDLGQNVSVLVNLAAVHRTPGHPFHEYYDTNINGALNAVALAETTEIPIIVFTSSISVYGPSEDVVTEASPLTPTSAYGRSKRMAETVHETWASRRPDRRLIVVRPGVVFGPGERGNYTYLAKALRGGYFFYPGRTDTVKSGGYVDELLGTIEFAIARSDPKIVYNFAYPAESSMIDIVRTFGRVAGVGAARPVLPLWPLLLAASVFEAANRIGLHNPIHRERVMKLVQSTRVAPRWLLENGYRFGTDLEAALQAWMRETAGRFE